MANYIVTTPKPTYSGKTYGVYFHGGRAFVSPHTIDASLGLSVEQIVKKMQEDFGYEVQQVQDRLPIVDTVLANVPADVVPVTEVVEAEEKSRKKR